ncbi:SCP2 sterol-binding domain-containing protein [Natronosporangium hydrolyticum]|uniref:SCP2 sterol-binding domain-containing protein n=1 Tax=Natronosporangium hydrolyticum TaxID=2811111 RepID=A0A895YAT3_9ACTN|nr:SCP2 sterol-binding domain-containing protein [Natronosporangium hydrolyticum]QSB12583.1 SCP2 sterol-binding domain-containing protein [Natronosporangium hydrolyticum]
MATLAECRAALTRLTADLTENAAKVRAKVNVDRTVVCRITDLDTAFRGRLIDGELRDVVEGDDPAAQVSISAASDDLIALVDGELDWLHALATRRLRIRAKPLDLLKLRNLR